MWHVEFLRMHKEANCYIHVSRLTPVQARDRLLRIDDVGGRSSNMKMGKDLGIQNFKGSKEANCYIHV